MESLTPERKRAFLLTLADTGQVKRAAQTIGMSRETVYQWRREDPEFAKAWERALEIAAEGLEDEAYRRAHDGVEEPVHYMGMAVDTVTKYSDTLLIFLLKGMKPEKYRERVEHSGTVDIAQRIIASRRRVNRGE